MIPKHEGKINISTEPFSFFNPELNQYIDLGVKSIVLNVLNSAQIAKTEPLEVNKPIDVLVKISGLGNLDEDKLPKLIESKDYTFFKPQIISKLSTNKEGVKGSKPQNMW